MVLPSAYRTSLQSGKVCHLSSKGGMDASQRAEAVNETLRAVAEIVNIQERRHKPEMFRRISYYEI